MKSRKFALISSILAILLTIQSPSSSSACTVITTSNGDAILFGYNEDRSQNQFDQKTTIRFYNATDSDFAYMGIEATEPGVFSLRVAVNEMGLAISGNGLPETSVTEHPDRPYSWRYNSFYNIIIRKCANISAVIDIANNFDFGPVMGFQAHIADKSGNAIVVSPGVDGEIAITHKTADYFISTNVDRDAIEQGTYDSRNKMATAVVENDNELNRDDIKAVLDTIHQEGPDAVTYYSTIFDLTNDQMYIYLWHDYTKEAVFDLDHEFSLGDHSYLLQNLFANGVTILQNGEQAFNRLVIVATLLRIIAVVLSVLILINLVYKTRKFYKTSLQSPQSKRKTISIKIIISLFTIVLILINAILLPLLLFTNFVDSMIKSQTIITEFYLFIGIWTISLSIGLFYLHSYRKNGYQTSESDVVNT